MMCKLYDSVFNMTNDEYRIKSVFETKTYTNMETLIYYTINDAELECIIRELELCDCEYTVQYHDLTVSKIIHY